MIKDFPIERYKFHIDEKNKVVVATSTFAKRKYKGIARCSPEDTFDIDFGKRLAALRCGLKIARARVEYAQIAYYTHQGWAEYFKELVNKDWKYLREAEDIERKVYTEFLELI